MDTYGGYIFDTRLDKSEIQAGYRVGFGWIEAGYRLNTDLIQAGYMLSRSVSISICYGNMYFDFLIIPNILGRRQIITIQFSLKNYSETDITLLINVHYIKEEM